MLTYPSALLVQGFLNYSNSGYRMGAKQETTIAALGFYWPCCLRCWSSNQASVELKKSGMYSMHFRWLEPYNVLSSDTFDHDFHIGPLLSWVLQLFLVWLSITVMLQYIICVIIKILLLLLLLYVALNFISDGWRSKNTRHKASGRIYIGHQMQMWWQLAIQICMYLFIYLHNQHL